MGKSAKRQRKNEARKVAAGVEEAAPSPITCLPFELIAEILLYSATPADILSLSRTCKHFCATLVQNPAAAFIWKRVRAQATPPVPDPAKLGFSEPQLADFIFGGGSCTVCGNNTRNMYTSFSARIRFCGNPKCRLKHSENCRDSFHTVPQYASWLPWIEWPNTHEIPDGCRFVISNGRVLFGGMVIHFSYDRGQLLQARNEYNKAAVLTTTLDEYKQRKQKYVDGLESYMNGCLELCIWRRELTKLHAITAVYNHAQIERFAVDQGRDKVDVGGAPTIARLSREKLLNLEKITQKDLEILWPEVQADLSRIESHRKRVEVEHSRLHRRREVEWLYRELDHSKFDCFPSLPQFRNLPTLRTFQTSTVDAKNTKWRNEFVDALVQNDIQEWATKTVQAFSELLKRLELSPVKTTVHPVHRISSRFTCTRCSKSGSKSTRNKSLTFREAAHHICLVSEKGNQDLWSPENFVADVKATVAITRFMTTVGMDVQEEITAGSVAISRHILCLSCSAPIVMGFDAMVQHSHRHDDMQFMVLADEELVRLSDYPTLPGVTAKLMRTNEQAKEWRNTISVGCKHCIPNPLATQEPEAGSNGGIPKPQKKPKAFKFDGIRSHLKEKHKVIEVADEDLFVFDEHLLELGYGG